MAAKGIYHCIRMSWFISEGEVEFHKEVLPLSLLGRELLLGGEVARHHIIGEEHEVRYEKIMMPSLHVMDHRSHFLLVHRVLLLSITELPSFESDHVTHLRENAANGVVRHVRVHLEGEREVREVKNRFRGNTESHLVKSLLTYCVPFPPLVLLEEIGQWGCNL